jgi:hypothetical protein
MVPQVIIQRSILNVENLSNKSNQEDEVSYVDQGELLIIQQSLSVVRDETKEWVCCNIFYICYSANGRVCDVIIDSGVCNNVVFNDMVNKLQLKMKAHL